jgi:hypothetical protein
MAISIRITRVWLAVFLSALLLALLGALAISSFRTISANAADTCQNFPETGFQACGRFLDYWKANGGLAQQGYPISNVFEEKNADPPAGDGKVHKVQYFQRARFEEHLENQPPYDVLLGLIGAEQYNAKYKSQPSSTPTPTAPAGKSPLVVNGKRNESKIGSYTPKDGYTFLVVDFTLTNTTAKEISSNSSYLQVKTNANFSYDYHLSSFSLSKGLKLIKLQPGESTRGELSFEIPVSETPVELLYYDFDNKFTAPL